MYLRDYREEDCAALAELFYETVHRVNRRDYTPEQLAAWATGSVDLAAWNTSFLAHKTVVAVEGDTIVGFGDMTSDGYLDRMYVHHAHQGEGIATAICDALEREVRQGKITTHASITAKSFFLGRGYRVVRQQTVVRQGVQLINFVMEKAVK